MKYLKSYNEGILSKAKEMFNYSKIADDLGKKYTKMIHDDWNKHHDLYRVSIIDRGDYITLFYLITNGDQNDVQIANRDENSMVIKLTYISNILNWNNDTTQARLDVDIFKSYLGELKIVGRNIKTGEIVENPNGSKDQYLSYINVPSNDVKKLMDFFIKQFKSRYPKMNKYYGKRSIMEMDPDLKKQTIESYEIKRKKEHESFEKRMKEEEKIVKSKLILKLDMDDILDYFVEISDSIKVKIDYSKSIYLDKSIFHISPSATLKEYVFTDFSINSLENKNKYEFTENDIPLEKGIPYHKIIISLFDDKVNKEELEEKVNKVLKRWTGENRYLKLGPHLILAKSKYHEDGGTHHSFMHFLISEFESRTWSDKSKATYLIYLSEN